MGKLVYRNFETHESQREFLVYYFYAKDRADFFESLLIEHEIPYERGAGKDLVRRHLFGIHESLQDQANKLNHEANQFFRKPFLGDNAMKYGVLIFTLLFIIVAIIGFLVSKG